MEQQANGLWTGFMTWEEILPYKEQIIDMELEVMIKFHYPDWNIPRSFSERKFAELEQHLADGNTYFWGAIRDGKLLGYRWAYTERFIDKLRWVGRSEMFLEEARGLGLGTMAQLAGMEKAMELGCDESETMYAPDNKPMAHILEKLGFEVTRIEVVKKFDKGSKA